MSPYPITLALAAGAAVAILAACGSNEPEAPGGSPLLFDGADTLAPARTRTRLNYPGETR